MEVGGGISDSGKGHKEFGRGGWVESFRLKIELKEVYKADRIQTVDG